MSHALTSRHGRKLNLLRIKKTNSVEQMQKAAVEYSAPSKIMRGDKPELAERVADLKMQIKKFFESMVEMFCVSKTKDEECEENETATKRIVALYDLYFKFAEAYRSRKQELGALDFADLESNLLKLLNSAAGKEISQNVEHLFVDEFQDTNRLQQEIYKKLNAKNYF